LHSQSFLYYVFQLRRWQSKQWWHYVNPIALLVIILLATTASVLWKAAKSNLVEAARVANLH